MEKKKILFISQETHPFLPKSEISENALLSPQLAQSEGKEIRAFMPRYGCINERRHQLHEVIRLSGQNLSIDDQDYPLIIKVASVSSARMQVYFIDNEEFFKRKFVTVDENGKEFKDNDERSMFFCRGVLETVKKLGWKPDVIHCHGWFTALMALYIKGTYAKDPHFAGTKVVYSLYNNSFETKWDKRLSEKLKFEGFESDILDQIEGTSCVEITKLIAKHVDGLIMSSETVSEEYQKIYDEASCHKLPFMGEDEQAKTLSEFFDKVIEDTVLV